MTGVVQRLAAGLIAAIAAVAPAAAQAPASLGPPSAELPPLEQLRATRERPLFTPTRRRPEVRVEAAAPKPPIDDKSLPFQLTGIVLGPDVRVAVLRQKGQEEELRLRAKDKVAGWTLAEIGEQYVILDGNGRRVRVWLVDNSKSGGVTVNGANAVAAPDKRSDVDQEIMPGEAPPQPAMRSPARSQARPAPRVPIVRPPNLPGPRPN